MYRDIIINEILIGQVYDMNQMKGVEFPTPSHATFQFGFGEITSQKTLVPHIHKRVKREIETTSEFLYVVKGKMIIDVFDENETFLEKVVLTDNMALLQFIGGHKIELESETQYFEIKQGPYYGRDFDKYEIQK